jgi:hypothetical protein
MQILDPMQILDHDRVTGAAERGARQFCALVAAADRPTPGRLGPGVCGTWVRT